MSELHTSISTHDATSIRLRGMDLVDDLLGKYSFTEALYLLITGKLPSTEYGRILDACLITLMDHGMTPHAIVTRLVGACNPQDAQTAIAAGLLCVGDVFSGTMDGCAVLLDRGIREHDDLDAYCRQVVAEHKETRRAIPGLGHPIHKPDDPRSPRLFEIAAANGVQGHHVDLLKRLAAAADLAYGRHLTINATGAIAALLLEIGMPVSTARGIAVVSRAGGLVAHLEESHRTKTGLAIQQHVEQAFGHQA